MSYRSNQTISPHLQISKGTALSLTSSGLFQAGAGTTVYKNILPLNVKCPKYIDLDSVYDDAYIFFHGYANTRTSVFDIITVNTANFTGQASQSVSVPYFLYEVATLSQSQGIFVSISQDFDGTLLDAIVVAGKVAANKTAISIGKPSPYQKLAADYSVDPRISRLSETTFAVTYFTKTNVATRYGKCYVPTFLKSY